MKLLILIFLSIVLSAQAQVSSKAQLQEGDIIFHQSQSSQSLALREITQSLWTHTGVIIRNQNKWFVVEAARGVEVTPLENFIDRGVGKKYIIKRLRPELTNQSQSQSISNKLKTALLAYAGLKYDFWFEWSDSTIYCSELVWKAYDDAFGIQLTTPERFRDFSLNGPYAQRLIQERYIAQGRQLNLDEPVVSPIALLESDLLVDVIRKD
jgi:uncharacterized protein YycO